MSLLGFQFWPNAPGAGEAAAFVRDLKPAVVKVLEPHTHDALATSLRELSPNTLVVFRFVAFFNDRQSILGRGPQEAALQAQKDYEELRPYLLPRKGKFDLLELFNEPSSAGPELEALIAYTEAFSRRAAEDGIRVASYCFATGTPKEESWSRLKALNPKMVVFAPHEYAWQNRPEWGWHLLRFEKWVPDGGLVLIGETGQEPGGLARWGGGAFQDLMAQYDRALMARPHVLGAAIFAWNGQAFGWGDYAIWPSQERWFREYLKANPPTYRRELLSTLNSQRNIREAPMSGIIRGIDVSSYSGRITPSQAKALKEQWGIQAAVIQLWGGGPGGTGPNRWMLSQAYALSSAGLEIGVYIWPPRAIAEYFEDIKAMVRGLIAVTGKRPFMVALDVEAGEKVSLAHIQLASRLGPAFIYTSPGEWKKIMGSTSFPDVPLWEANYTRKFRTLTGAWTGKWPTEEDRPWDPVTPGFKESPAWQFMGTTSLSGVTCDLNVFHPKLFS